MHYLTLSSTFPPDNLGRTTGCALAVCAHMELQCCAFADEVPGLTLLELLLPTFFYLSFIVELYITQVTLFALSSLHFVSIGVLMGFFFPL